MLVGSYNPRGRGSFKELRPSLRQRFVSIEMGYLDPGREAELIMGLSGVDRSSAERLVGYASALRAKAVEAFVDPPFTRTLVHAAELIAGGVP